MLVGASLGGRIVFEAAARAPEGPAGIVSLSGERRIDDYRDILPGFAHGTELLAAAAGAARGRPLPRSDARLAEAIGRRLKH